MMESRPTKVEDTLARTNLARLRVLFAMVFGVEAVFLFYVERIRLVEASNEEYPFILTSYLLHLLLAVLAAVIVITSHKLVKDKENAWNDFRRRFTPLVVFVTLALSATISVFDQITTGHIIVFTVKLLVFGLVLFIRPPWQWTVFGVPFLVFLLGLVLFQDDNAVLLTHLINGTAIFAGVMFASHHFYNHKYDDLRYRMTLKRLNRRLEELSTHDPLTKLANRRLFEKQIRYELAINKRYNQRASLLLIDIDHFKKVNDNHGHKTGDEVLVELASFLVGNVRESDTVCRWGGEEFMLLLSHTDTAGAEVLANRLRQEIGKRVFLAGKKDISLTVSIGVAELESTGEDPFKSSYEAVDKALYEAKESGRNKVRVQ